MKWTTMLIIFLAISILLTAGCSEEKVEQKCCAECLASWSQSPAAVGPEGAYCGRFMTAKEMSAECKKHFEDIPTTVSVCNEIQ